MPTCGANMRGTFCRGCCGHGEVQSPDDEHAIVALAPAVAPRPLDADVSALDSSCGVQGEGEIKILSRVLRPWGDAAPEDEHAIVALDSDMALMALMMPNANVYVLAEPARYMPRMARSSVFSLAELARHMRCLHDPSARARASTFKSC